VLVLPVLLTALLLVLELSADTAGAAAGVEMLRNGVGVDVAGVAARSADASKAVDGATCGSVRCVGATMLVALLLLMVPCWCRWRSEWRCRC
jgi:hypothetical protein